MTPAEMAARLRALAFDTQAFDAASASDEPYGVICEFRDGEAVVTATAFATGDASLYFSSGGGVIGGIGKPEVAELARSIVSDVAPLVPKLERDDSTALPGPGDYCFYVLTPGGRRVCRVNSTGKALPDSPEVKLIRLVGPLLTKFRQLAN